MLDKIVKWDFTGSETQPLVRYLWYGFYVGNSTTSYVRNAAIYQCEMPAGYADLGATCNGAGFYIGGNAEANNITVNMDNCDIYGIKQPIVLRGSSGEQNNSLYISNSSINMDYTSMGNLK